MKKLIISILALILTFPALYGYADSSSNIIEVSGSATSKLQPDSAIITLDINIQDKNIKNGQKKCKQITDNIYNKLIGIGVDKEHIRNENYSIFPAFDEGTKNKIFNVGNEIAVKIYDLEKIPQIIDSLEDNVGVNIQYLSSLYKEEYNILLKEALKNATIKAEILAQNSNASNLKIKNIQENSSENRFESAMQFKSANDFNMIEPSEIVVRTDLRVQFSME